jgi:L-alanine-DL-glutamate epimerase-like enolase superfamily enzyme
MRITAVRVRVVAVPDEDLLAGAAERQAAVRAIVTLCVRTDAGADGIGIAFAFGGLTRPLAGVVQELAELTIGEDPARIEAVTAKLRNHAATFATSGMFLTALSAIDCALWDIRGKVAGQPLWQLLGGCRQRVPGYASGQLHRGLADADLAGAAERILARGFRYLKLHLGLDGDPSPAHELERARLVRGIVGPHMHLGCDINERWSVGRAIDVGRRLEEIGLCWLEDPTRGDDYAGLARIAAALSAPIMAGENSWGVTPFRLMLEARSVDLLMIDLMHVGGITPWLKIAAMAEAFNVPVVSHIMPEFQAQLVAAVPNGLMAEHKAWTWRLFDGVPEFAGGDFVLSDRPGHGLSFSREFGPHLR